MIDDKFPWEIDDFQPLEPELHGRALVAFYMAIDDIIVGLVFVHQVRESCLDARTLLVDGIIKRVRQAIHCSLTAENSRGVPAEPLVNKPKAWTLGGRIKNGLKKIAEDLDIITCDDENYK